MAIKMALPLRRRPIPIVFAVVCLTAIAGFHLPLVPTILVLAPLSIAVARRVGS
jgi:chromate transporter